MATIITVADLPASIQSAELVDVMVAAANARASRVAPCLADTATPPSDDQLAEAKLVLIGMVKRWTEAGAGAISQQSAGPFQMSVDTRQRTGFNPWPSEIEALQDICSDGTASTAAFSITPTGSTVTHMPWCSINMGAVYCSCGADIAGYPLYEGGALSEDTY